MSDIDSWGSVRKVRFKDVLLSLVLLLSQEVDVDRDRIRSELRELVRKETHRREELRQQSTQRVRRSATSLINYESQINDYLAFARGIGLLNYHDNKVEIEENTSKIAKLIGLDREEAEGAILKKILTSKYSVYLSLLLRLQELEGSFAIPYQLLGRTKETTEYLQENGFRTDCASFFAARDLLYDFSLVNWARDPSQKVENIFMTSVLSRTEIDGYKHAISLDTMKISYGKLLKSDEFKEAVMSKYFETTKGAYDIVLDIMELRDLVTRSLQISDFDFDNLIVVLDGKVFGKSQIILSQGVVSIPFQSGYLIKAINLPILPSGRRVEYISVHQQIS